MNNKYAKSLTGQWPGNRRGMENGRARLKIPHPILACSWPSSSTCFVAPLTPLGNCEVKLSSIFSAPYRSLGFQAVFKLSLHFSAPLFFSILPFVLPFVLSVSLTSFSLALPFKQSAEVLLGIYYIRHVVNKIKHFTFWPFHFPLVVRHHQEVTLVAKQPSFALFLSLLSLFPLVSCLHACSLTLSISSLPHMPCLITYSFEKNQVILAFLKCAAHNIKFPLSSSFLLHFACDLALRC